MIERVKNIKSLPLLFWLIIALAAHIFVINTPFVNLEYVFASAAYGLANPEDIFGLSEYWNNQANPLGYSFFSSILFFIFNFEITPWLARIPSLIGIIILIFSVFSICSNLKDVNINKTFWAIALIIMFPLIWVFSGRAVADMLSAGLFFLSIAILFKSKKLERSASFYFSSLIFGVAVVVKYNVLLLFPAITLLIWDGLQKKSLRSFLLANILYFIAPMAIFISYNFFTYVHYDVLITSKKFAKTHRAKFDVYEYIVVFCQYLSYLTIFLGGMGLFSIATVYKRLGIRGLLVIFSFGAICSFILLSKGAGAIGEMDSGIMFGTMIPLWLRNVIRVGMLIVGVVILIDLFFESLKGNKMAIFVFSTSLFYLLIASATRPAQRYLIFIIPLFLFFYISSRVSFKNIFSKSIIYFTLCFYVIVDFLLVGFQVAQGSASESMAAWILSKGIEKQTEPGSIKPHSGIYFTKYKEFKKEYTVKTSINPDERIIHKEDLNFLGKTIKSYYLVKHK